MKKIIIASMIAASAVAAQAETSVSVQYSTQDTAGTSLKSQNTVLAVQTSLAKNLDADVGIYQNQFEKINKVSTRQEIGATYKTSVSGIGAYVRGATGYKAVSGSDTVAYYSIEPGVVVDIPFVSGLSASIAYRFRDSFSSADSLGERSDTTRYAVSYNLTKADKITFRVDDQRGVGAVSQTITGLTYTRSF